ncbi:MAG: aspartate kinase [Bacteroidetes bacterium]|nr:MAG: aspartate kinase [Bacteroidota bacterium]
MKILKFGQSTLDDIHSFERVLENILQSKKTEKHILVVVSSMKNVAQQLQLISQKSKDGDNSYKTLLAEIEERHFLVVKHFIDVKHQAKVLANLKVMLNDLEDILHGIYLLWELSPRTADHISTYPLKMMAYLVSECLKQKGFDSEYIDTQKIIATDNVYQNASIDYGTTASLTKKNIANADIIYVLTGNLGATAKGESTSLGKAGGTLTATLMGSILNASEVIIYTDRDGVTNTDSSLNANAYSLPILTYSEAKELSNFDTKVIYPPSLQPAFAQNIPVIIKNLYNPAFEGTKIIGTQMANPSKPIKANSTIQNITLLNIQGSGMIGKAGTASRIFKVLAENKISVILIIQASSEHSITLAIAPEYSIKAHEVLSVEFEEELKNNKIDKIGIKNEMAIVAMIGENMQHTPGIAGKIFSALGNSGINVAAIAQGSSEYNITIVIENHLLIKALAVLQEKFF